MDHWRPLRDSPGLGSWRGAGCLPVLMLVAGSVPEMDEPESLLLSLGRWRRLRWRSVGGCTLNNAGFVQTTRKGRIRQLAAGDLMHIVMHGRYTASSGCVTGRRIAGFFMVGLFVAGPCVVGLSIASCGCGARIRIASCGCVKWTKLPRCFLLSV